MRRGLIICPIRREAKRLGHVHYENGLTCKRGHVAKKYTRNGDCVTCAAMREKNRYDNNISGRRDAIRAQSVQRLNDRRSRKVSPFSRPVAKITEKRKVQMTEWREANRAKVKRISAERYKRKKIATPKWADLAKIKKFYEKCPPGFEVDHAIPLFGETVCGLHVHNNLQYMTPRRNRQKTNYFNQGDWEFDENGQLKTNWIVGLEK